MNHLIESEGFTADYFSCSTEDMFKRGLDYKLSIITSKDRQKRQDSPHILLMDYLNIRKENPMPQPGLVMVLDDLNFGDKGDRNNEFLSYLPVACTEFTSPLFFVISTQFEPRMENKEEVRLFELKGFDRSSRIDLLKDYHFPENLVENIIHHIPARPLAYWTFLRVLANEKVCKHCSLNLLFESALSTLHSIV